jgi:hypothetical protein
MPNSKPEEKYRVISYIDGYNLYHGMQDKARIVDGKGNQVNREYYRYMWSDLVKLSASLLRPNQELIATKYFTSRVSGNVASEERQAKWLDVISTLPSLSIYYGTFQTDPKKCPACQKREFHPQEKKTDVNIATQMICDGLRDKFDTALLITGDSDQVPTIQMITHEFNKSVIVAFPPERLSAELKLYARANMTIGAQKFKDAIMSHSTTLPNGVVIECPQKWR